MSEQTNLLLMTYSKYFPEENIMMLKQKFDQLDESKKSLMYSLQFKDPITTLILSLLVGGLGIVLALSCFSANGLPIGIIWGESTLY